MRAKKILQAGSPASAPVHDEPNHRQRILVVEDDEAIRRVNTDVLINSGYEVDAAEDGASAWNALQRTDYDLVVTDNNMPKVTGVELIQKIQAAGLAVPVIMATGTMPDDNFDPFRSLQPAITLLKPFFSHELLSAVRRVLRAADDSLPEMAPPPNLQVRPSSPACSRRPT